MKVSPTLEDRERLAFALGKGRREGERAHLTKANDVPVTVRTPEPMVYPKGSLNLET